VKRPNETSGLTRREAILKTLFGAGFVGLRALATGLPISFLLNPRKALAANSPLPAPCSTNPNAQYLILATSGQGDPINANCPGSYVTGIGHPTDQKMAATNFNLGSFPTTAALPWSALPPLMLAQSCFFHHATYTLIHPDEPNVMALMGYSSPTEMLVSMIAKQMSACLGTVQQQPVALGPESVTFGGQPLPNLPPLALSTMLAAESGPLGQLVSLRDQTLNSIHSYLQTEGNSAQAAFVANYANSRNEARELSQTLIGALATQCPDNTPASQLNAASLLIQMNVAPVIVVHQDFGADNHSDANLATETSETLSTLANLGTFWQSLQTVGTGNQISMAFLNVFGRTLAASTSANGRGHNPNHHVMVMIGSPFVGSVIGGVEPTANQPGATGGDFAAMAIDPSTGVGVSGGGTGNDIPFSQTFQSAALTLATGIGCDLSQEIIGGQVVNSALVNPP
jgi:Protein of unknown function (DUF1501)